MLLLFVFVASILFCIGQDCPSSTNIIRPLLDGKIVGGIPVDITDYPFQVSLAYKNSHICGASIVASSYALGAAHCADGKLSAYKIRAGSSISNKGGRVYSLVSISIHPNWNSNTMDFDAALYKIKGIFALGTPGVASISLATNEPSTGTATTVSGWGVTSSGSSTVEIQLRAVNVTITARKKCNKDYSNYGGINDTMICAAAPGKDSCQGDSGGPLTVVESDKPVLAGIVSWGIGCANSSFPGVYTNIADPTIYNWIDKSITTTFSCSN